MSNVPPDYIKATSFTTLATQPITISGLPGSQLDSEFTNVSETVNQTIDRLSLVQKDDGSLRSKVVTIDSLSPETAAAITTAGARISGEWAVGAKYVPGDVIIYGADNYAYICAVTHTASANFESDFSAKAWAILGYRPPTNDLVVKTFTGDGSTLTFSLGINPVSENNTQVFVSGVYRSKSTYSISGTNLVFSAGNAPANAAPIEVVIGVPAELISNVVTIPNNSVGTSAIIDLNVTGAKIADGTITTGKLADQSVTSAKIENNAVGSTKITDLSIGTDKLAGGAVTTTKIAPGAVIVSSIGDSAIETIKIAAGAVTTAKISTDAVTSTKIANGAVTSGKLSTGGPTWGSHFTDISSGYSGEYYLSLTPNRVGDGNITISFGSTVGNNNNASITRFNGANSDLHINQTGTGNTVFLNPNSAPFFQGPNGFSFYKDVNNTSNFPVPAGTAPIYGARAWVNFDATRNAAGGTDALMTDRFIRNSANVQKVTKTANGMFDVYFTKALPANYCVSGSYNESGTNTATASNGTFNGYYNTTAIAKVSCTGFGSSGANAAHIAAVFFA